MGYIEDLYQQGGMVREFQSNVTDTCCSFTSLGFVVHSVKSVLAPAGTLSFLGFCSDFCQYNCVSPHRKCVWHQGQCRGLISSVSISVQRKQKQANRQTPFRITMVVS